VNTYSLNALRRFANIVNTALIMPIPSSTENALVSTLKHLEVGQAASDAARILLAKVSAQSNHDIATPNSVLNSVTTNHSLSTPTEEPVFAPIIDEPVINNTETDELINEQNISINEPIAEPVEQLEQLLELVTDIQIEIPPSSAIALEIPKKMDRQVLSAPVFFQMLPWRIANTETSSKEDLAYERFLTKSLDIKDTLSATRFFQSLCWSSNSAQFSISAGIGASGGSIAPTSILAANSHTTLPMQQFFSQIPWTGKQSA